MSFFKLVNLFKTRIMRGIIVLIIIPILIFGAPQKAHAQWFTSDLGDTFVNTTSSIWGGITSAATSINTALTQSLVVKEYFGDGIANFIAKMIVKQLTAQTVNWINSGFKGNPAYVTNPQQFFLSIGDNTASQFLSSTKLAALCTPFNVKVRLALVKNYINEDQQNYSCTINKVVANYDNFTKDFTQGGWDGWFSMTQNDTNNPFGAYTKAQDQLSIQIANKQKTVETQLSQGSGFLSQKKCVEWSKAPSDNTAKAKQVNTGDALADYYTNTQVDISVSNDPSGEEQGDENLLGQTCLKSEVVTPGKVIADQLNKAIGSSIDGLIAADEINEVISALMTQLVSRVVGGIGNGLRGASQPSVGQSSLIQQIQDSLATTSTENVDFKNKIDQGIKNALTPPVIKTQAEVEAEAQAKVDAEKAKFTQTNCTATNTCPPGTPITPPPVPTPSTTIPVINLIGSNTLSIPVNTSINLLQSLSRAQVVDSVLGSQIIFGALGNINTTVPGTYIQTYTYTDSNGLSATPVTRTVTITP